MVREEAEHFQVGDTVRAKRGEHKGKLGTVVRVVEHSSGPATALVGFLDGTADYCRREELERVAGPEGRQEGSVR